MAVAVLVDERAAELVRVAEQLDVPDGYRVEVITGEIVVSPAPAWSHAIVASALQTALREVSPDTWHIVQGAGVVIEQTGERYIPDLAIARAAAVDDDRELVVSRTVLVAEITSPSNATTDRVRKLRGYALGEAPIYLLVEPVERTVTLFSDPMDGHYRSHVQACFGAVLPLPEPFTADLDTGKLM